jgi:hypothetical protein
MNQETTHPPKYAAIGKFIHIEPGSACWSDGFLSLHTTKQINLHPEDGRAAIAQSV